MKGYEAINWLAAGVILKRGFAERLEKEGLDTVLESCHYDDLTDEQRAVFEAALEQPLLKAIIETWWEAYDVLKASGALPSIRNGDPWWP